jgi:hypothetical protein
MSDSNILRPPLRFTTREGESLLLVPLASGGFATIEEADFERLTQLGYSPNLTRNRDRGGRG